VDKYYIYSEQIYEYLVIIFFQVCQGQDCHL
jgi:hypothetical protein